MNAADHEEFCGSHPLNGLKLGSGLRFLVQLGAGSLKFY
jgi:hypothetical protein